MDCLEKSCILYFIHTDTVQSALSNLVCTFRSKKRHKMDHPVLFKNIRVKKVAEHKHLGIIVNSKLFFQLISNLLSQKREGALIC